MWSKLSKNCIIEGPVTSFCLVCERLVRNVDEVDKHIGDPVHGDRLSLYPYLERYSRDCIRKIKGMYLCECCSVVLKTSTMVTAHICTREHVNNRGRQQLRAGPDNAVLALDGMLISEDAWHAIDDNCCSLCDEETDSQHKHSTKHLLKLVQSTIEFVENGLYRKIDKDTVQCLTCNVIFDMNSISNHYDSEDHKAAFAKSKVQENKINGEIKTENTNTGNLKSSKPDIEKAKDNQKNLVSEIEKIKILSHDNRITYNTGHDSAYCRVCDVEMSSTLHAVKEHVVDIKHVNKLKPKLVTTPSVGFFKKTIVINNDSFQDAVINYKFCISFWTFNMLFKNSEDEMQCHICEHDDVKSPLIDHVMTPRHANAMKKFKIVTTFHDEFLREIRPGVVHCGFCNILVPKWDDIVNHLESVDHKAAKMKWQVRLELHLPGLLVEDGLACKVDKDTIRCLICNIKLHILSINNHYDTEEHKAAFNIVDEKAIEAEIKESKKIPQANTSSHDSVYCRVCDVTMSSSQRSTHVTDIKHVNKLKSNKPTLVKEPFKQFAKERNMFVDSTVDTKNMYGYFIINNKICIPMNSYLGIGTNSEGLRCHICKQNLRLTSDLNIGHATSSRHMEGLENALVVTSISNEFVREIHPGVFHCGFCNVVISTWDDVSNHLESANHKCEKAACQDKLKEPLEVLQQMNK